jgi:hypothetical protein
VLRPVLREAGGAIPSAYSPGYTLVALCTMAFATILLPNEMMFAHHPTLAFAVPFAAAFVGVYLLRSGIETVAACAMLAVLAVAVYRAIIEG